MNMSFNLVARIFFSLFLNFAMMVPLFAMQGQYLDSNLNERLFDAIDTMKLELVGPLLDHGANPNAYSKFGTTALVSACELPPRLEHRTNKIKICSLLLERGAHVNAQCENGNTPLIIACWYDYCDYELCDLLLKHGADVNFKSYYGVTALSFCLKPADSTNGHGTIAHQGRVEICELLLKNNANIEQPTAYAYVSGFFESNHFEKVVGVNVLIKAAELQDEEMCRLFVNTQAARIKVQRILTLLWCLKNSSLRSVVYKEIKKLLQPHLRTMYFKPVDLLKVKDSTGKMAFDYLPRAWLNPDIG